MFKFLSLSEILHYASPQNYSKKLAKVNYSQSTIKKGTFTTPQTHLTLVKKKRGNKIPKKKQKGTNPFRTINSIKASLFLLLLFSFRIRHALPISEKKWEEKKRDPATF